MWKKRGGFAAVYPEAASFDEAKYRTEYLTRYLDENGFPEDQVFVNKVTFAQNNFGMCKVWSR